MVYNKSYKFRAYPNEEQINQLNNWFGQSRFIFNHFLSMRKNLYKAYKVTTNIGDIDMNLNSFENFNTPENMANYLVTNSKKEFAWLKMIPSQCLQQKLIDLDSAYVKMRKERTGYPKFKSKKKSKHSIRFPQISQCIFNPNNELLTKGRKKVKLPKLIGELEFGSSKQFGRMIGKRKNITLSQDPDGKYYISISCEITSIELDKSFNKNKTKKNHMPKNPKGKIGIDLGLKSIIVDSNGKDFAPNNVTKNYDKKLKKVGRQHSKKENGSKNKVKSRIKLAKVHKKIANIRKDFIHKITTNIIRENQTIVMEDLNTKGMIKNRKLSKSISNASWGEFKRQLTYKSLWYNRELRIINRFYPSSKLCSTKSCGYKNINLVLSDRNWNCPNCGITHDRDKNAATNILNCNDYKVLVQRTL